MTGTVTSATTGVINQIRFGDDAGMNSTVIGHVAVGNTSTAFNATAGVLVGWHAEEAASRIARIGGEEELHAYPTSAGDEQCGIQPSGTALEVMRAAGEVDEGILGEQRAVLGLRYVTRASMYNQPAALVLDYTGDDGLVTPLEPTDDDQGVTNDVTVARTSGSSARLTQSTGALSTQAPPDGIGLYDTSHTLNLLNDDQPLQHAGWRLHLGTWDETRFPQVSVNLANAPASIEAAAGVDTGSRLQILNSPAWLPPGPIDLLVQGYTETLDQFEWKITYNCAPARPFDVAWLGAGSSVTAARQLQWLDTDGSQLAEPLDTTETTVDVHTLTGPRWTPNVSDTPFDWRVGGEVMTVTASGAFVNPNPFFDTDLTGWSGAASGTSIARSTTVIPPHPRARASMQVTPAGGFSAVSARSDLTGTGQVIPGQRWKISGWFYSPGGWPALYPSAQWADAGGSVVASGGISQAVPAGQWTYLEDTVTVPASATQVRIVARADGTPTSADVFYVWGLRICRVSSSALYDEFGRTASSAWGQAASGQTWSTSGGTAADYNVTGGYGAHRLATTNASRRSFTPFTYTDFDAYVSLTRALPRRAVFCRAA
ncbi:hypothetical protein DN402_31810 [Streptomyces sp. SW4]|nr:hypothetical protein DN402_31810 [Streptomyces sp. SW4]